MESICLSQRGKTILAQEVSGLTEKA